MALRPFLPPTHKSHQPPFTYQSLALVSGGQGHGSSALTSALLLALTDTPRNRSTSLATLVGTDVDGLPLQDQEQHFVHLSEALWDADRTGTKTPLVAKARERITQFLGERMDPVTEAQLKQALAQKKEHLLADVLEVCGVHGYISKPVQQCRELLAGIMESAAAVRAAVEKCDRELLGQAIAKCDEIGYGASDKLVVRARAMLQRIARIDEEAAKVQTEAGCIEERVRAVLVSAHAIGYTSPVIQNLRVLAADPTRFLSAQYNAAVARQDCDCAIHVAVRRKDVHVQRYAKELQLEKCGLLRGGFRNTRQRHLSNATTALPLTDLYPQAIVYSTPRSKPPADAT